VHVEYQLLCRPAIGRASLTIRRNSSYVKPEGKCTLRRLAKQNSPTTMVFQKHAP
jgi:hypothetical protein